MIELVERLEEDGYINIIITDNASSYKNLPKFAAAGLRKIVCKYNLTKTNKQGIKTTCVNIDFIGFGYSERVCI